MQLLCIAPDLAREPQRVSNRLKQRPLIMHPQDSIPAQHGGPFHSFGLVVSVNQSSFTWRLEKSLNFANGFHNDPPRSRFNRTKRELARCILADKPQRVLTPRLSTTWRLWNELRFANNPKWGRGL